MTTEPIEVIYTYAKTLGQKKAHKVPFFQLDIYRVTQIVTTTFCCITLRYIVMNSKV